MHCRRIQKWMTKNPAALSTAQKQKYDSHLKLCATCRKADQALKNLDQDIVNLKSIQTPSWITENFWYAIRNEIQPKTEQKKHLIRPKFNIQTTFAWGIPSLAVICLLLWFVLIKPVKQTTLIFSEIQSSNIIIESATVDGRDARVMTFQFKNPEFTVIWLE